MFPDFRVSNLTTVDWDFLNNHTTVLTNTTEGVMFDSNETLAESANATHYETTPTLESTITLEYKEKEAKTETKPEVTVAPGSTSTVVNLTTVPIETPQIEVINKTDFLTTRAPKIRAENRTKTQNETQPMPTIVMVNVTRTMIETISTIFRNVSLVPSTRLESKITTLNTTVSGEPKLQKSLLLSRFCCSD